MKENLQIRPSTGLENNTAQPKTDKWFSSTSHFSSFYMKNSVNSFNCCIMSSCSLIKGTTPKMYRLFCPNEQRSFEHFMSLDFVYGLILRKGSNL